MTRIEDIQGMPATIRINGQGYHESLTQASSILRYVKELLEINTPPSVILTIIEECQRIQGPEFTDPKK